MILKSLLQIECPAILSNVLERMNTWFETNVERMNTRFETNVERLNNAVFVMDIEKDFGRYLE